MDEQDIAKLSILKWTQSRIPALDALVLFVPLGQEKDPVVEAAIKQCSSSRWYPVEGGNRLLIPYQGETYDTERFTIEKGAWDHEHCNVCGKTIEPMTLCWVTKSGHYVILCTGCYQRHVQVRRPWWHFWSLGG